MICQIVKEQDEDVLCTIEQYVKNLQSKGELVTLNIIPEGRLRHIINLGVTLYNDMEHKRTTPDNLLDEQRYVEYLKQQLEEQIMENQKLKNKIELLENGYRVVNLDES